ncbi:MAG: uroporphyrinogen-III C-methyltransferase, partial [Polyangiales bacterium]
RRRMAPPKGGKVWLVGAGPGDPDLLTVRALRIISSADVIAYDELVSEEILACTAPDAERIPVGRRAAGVRHHEESIHPVVIERARRGLSVVRLKAGDPMIFGRGGEEAIALAEAEIPFEIVPGISAAIGAAASAAIPLTHRGVSASLTLVSAHRIDGAEDALATVPRDGTLAIYMGATRLGSVADALMRRGWSPTTPVAVIASATQPNERVTTATLETLAAVEAAPPAIVIVGEVVGVRTTSPALKIGCEASAPSGMQARKSLCLI